MCQSLSNASDLKIFLLMNTLSISDIIVDVLYVLVTCHFLNMRYLQTQQLTTMFRVQRSVSHIFIFLIECLLRKAYVLFVYKWLDFFGFTV